LGASNNSGFINLFPMLDNYENDKNLPKGASPLAPVTLNEVSQIKSHGEFGINKFEFSPYIESMLAFG
jgi:hypothetical protein